VGREAIEVDEQRTTRVLTNGVLGSKKRSMFRADQVTFLLMVFFRWLIGWLLGNREIACFQQSLQPALVDHGSWPCGVAAPHGSDIERMTTRLDPVPFDCLASDTPAFRRYGGSALTSRPAPPGGV
jgi:hypothetical protein